MIGKIGIRKENKDITEKRAPLTPDQVKELIDKYSLQVVVEPADNRIFKNEEYQQAGAQISNNLKDCNIIFGVKEIPIPDFIPGNAYCFFSHTIKGQSYNMPMLKRILDLRNTLLDYEKVTDENGKRIIFFGKFAGYAGMIDTLWAFGQRLKWEGFETPFAEIKQALHYTSLEEAKNTIRLVGEKILKDGLPHELTPLICGFTGYGQVSQGAQEIFDLLPVQTITVAQLKRLPKAASKSKNLLFKVVFKEEDMVEPINSAEAFNLHEYYENPSKFRSKFANYIPYLTILINGIYWEPRYPRLLTKAYLKKFYQEQSDQKLKIIGDISCDIEGSIECTVKTTNSQNPVYVYDPLKDQTVDGWVGNGPVILAVDKLPAELPREASTSFGKALLPFVPALAKTNFNLPYSQLNLPDEFKKAVIAHQGFLTPPYKYLQKFISP